MITIFAILTYILNIVDLIITKHFISMFGLGVESNPIGVWLFEHNLAEFSKIVIAGLGILFMWIPASKYNFIFAKICIYICFFVYFVLTVYHTYLLIKVHM